MLKKILFVVAILAVMLPTMAAEKDGKWFVDLTYRQLAPTDLDTVYAHTYSYSYTLGGPYGAYDFKNATHTYKVKPDAEWDPQIKFGYENDKWAVWMDMWKYDDTGHSEIATPADSYWLIPTLTFPTDTLLGYDGFAYADGANAQMALNTEIIDINYGRKFHPGERWTLMFYTGVRWFKTDVGLTATYYDNQDWNYWGVGAKDQVSLTSSNKGFGVNLGLTTSSFITKKLSVNGGVEISMVHNKRTDAQSEYLDSPFIGPYYGSLGLWVSSNRSTKIMNQVALFAEAQYDWTPKLYTKLGYKFQTFKNVFSYEKLVNDYPMWSGFTTESNDLAYEGMYFSLGYKFGK